jgi:hypothetical protein
MSAVINGSGKNIVAGLTGVELHPTTTGTPRDWVMVVLMEGWKC